MRGRRAVLGRGVALGTLAVTPALASGGGGESGLGLWAVLFLAFGAVVVLFQAVPAAVLFVSMLRSLFAPARRREKAGVGARRAT